MSLFRDWNCFRRRRYVIALLGFFSFCNLYLLRINLSITMVAMTASYPVTLPNGTIIDRREFNWDTVDRGKILSSFFYGYMMTQILGGWLSNRYGGVKIYGTSSAISGFLTLLTPKMANAGINFMIALRIAIGAAEGLAYPSLLTIWAAWAPEKERTTLVTISITGMYCGIVLGMTVCGVLAEKFGWPSTFYVTASLAIFGSFIWLVFAKDNPEHDPWITQEEKTYLRENVRKKAKKLNYPVKGMLKSVPVYAIFCAGFCELWGSYSTMTQMPVFLNDVYKFDVRKSGFLSALPYVISIFANPLAGYSADLLLQKNILTGTQVRKLFVCGAFLTQFICITLVAFSTTPEVSITLLTISVGLGCFSFATIDVNFLDLAPQYAGILSGTMNTVGTLTGMISPVLSGYIVINKTMDDWRTVFLITSGVYIVGATLYGLFGSGEIQHWAEVVPDVVPPDETNKYGNNQEDKEVQ